MAWATYLSYQPILLFLGLFVLDLWTNTCQFSQTWLWFLSAWLNWLWFVITTCVNMCNIRPSYVRVYKHQNRMPITHSALRREAGPDYKSRRPRRWPRDKVILTVFFTLGSNQIISNISFISDSYSNSLNFSRAFCLWNFKKFLNMNFDPCSSYRPTGLPVLEIR